MNSRCSMNAEWKKKSICNTKQDSSPNSSPQLQFLFNSMFLLLFYLFPTKNSIIPHIIKKRMLQPLNVFITVSKLSKQISIH